MTKHPEQRVLVCGGRHYADRAKVYSTLDALSPEPPDNPHPGRWLPQGVTIITGKCPTGADQIAGDWAIVNWTGLEEYPVDHALDGPWPAAGPRRNQRMLERSRPTLGIAFPGGRGTADMVRRMRAAGIPVQVIE